MPMIIETTVQAGATKSSISSIEGLIELLLRIATNHNETLLCDEGELDVKELHV